MIHTIDKFEELSVGDRIHIPNTQFNLQHISNGKHLVGESVTIHAFLESDTNNIPYFWAADNKVRMWLIPFHKNAYKRISCSEENTKIEDIVYTPCFCLGEVRRIYRDTPTNNLISSIQSIDYCAYTEVVLTACYHPLIKEKADYRLRELKFYKSHEGRKELNLSRERTKFQNELVEYLDKSTAKELLQKNPHNNDSLIKLHNAAKDYIDNLINFRSIENEISISADIRNAYTSFDEFSKHIKVMRHDGILYDVVEALLSLNINELTRGDKVSWHGQVMYYWGFNFVGTKYIIDLKFNMSDELPIKCASCDIARIPSCYDYENMHFPDFYYFWWSKDKQVHRTNGLYYEHTNYNQYFITEYDVWKNDESKQLIPVDECYVALTKEIHGYLGKKIDQCRVVEKKEADTVVLALKNQEEKIMFAKQCIQSINAIIKYGDKNNVIGAIECMLDVLSEELDKK